MKKRLGGFLLLLALIPMAALAAGRTTWAYQGKMAYFEHNGKIGMTSRSMTMIAPTMDEAWPFWDGVATVREDDRWGLLSQEGRWLRQPFSAIPVEFLFDGDYGRYATEDHSYGFVNRKGETVIEPKGYTDAGHVSEGLFAATKGQGYGYVNVKGEVVIDFQYTRALPFTEGVAAVQKDSVWGYIDSQGKEVLPFGYKEAGMFVRGMAAVRLAEGENTVYINQTGEVCLTGKWDTAYDFTADKLARVCVEGKYGFINEKGKLVIAARYLEANDFSSGYTTVKQGEGKWVILDAKGKICSKTYLAAEPYDRGFVRVSWTDEKTGKEKTGYLNAGKKIISLVME